MNKNISTLKPSMSIKTMILSSLSCAYLLSHPTIAYSDGHVYANFPITEKSYSGDKKTSVSYTGQIARHLLHDSLKILAGQGNGKANAGLKNQMLAYYKGSDKGHEVLSHTSKANYKQSRVEQISKGKNLSGKTYKGSITGMPNNMSADELITFWIDKASSANKGYDMTYGYNYPQLISKFILGAVFYNQAVDNYLDEKMTANNKPNDKPYKDGAAYTGKEHSWDEAFGYFGTPAHALELDGSQLYTIAKQKDKGEFSDYNKDGMIDLYTEMVYIPSYYAGGTDKSSKGKTSYNSTITQAFLDGRKLITAANGKKLTDSQRKKLMGYADVITKNWELTIAESAYKYAGSVYKDIMAIQKAKAANEDISKLLKNYIKHWGELKGFVLSLETGKTNNSALARKLTSLIGYGPVMPDGSQVDTITSNGQYITIDGKNIENYALHMLKAQKALANAYNIKAKLNDATADLASLTDKLGEIEGSETD